MPARSPSPLMVHSIWRAPALKPATDTKMGMYLVIKVNGRRIECIGGDWGMDDAMKNVSREHLEPYIRLEHDAHLNIIRNWAGQSTSEAFYDLCDYGISADTLSYFEDATWNPLLKRTPMNIELASA